MALRLIEIFHEEGKAKEIAYLLKEHPVLHTWHDTLPGGETVTRVLTRAEDAELMLNEMQDCCGRGLDLRFAVFPTWCCTQIWQLHWWQWAWPTESTEESGPPGHFSRPPWEPWQPCTCSPCRAC